MTAIERMVNGDKNAVWEVIEENSKLIHSALKSWHFRDGTNEYDDVVSEIKLILAKSLPKFDPNKGCQLSTYMMTIIFNKLKTIKRAEGKKSTLQMISLETPMYINEKNIVTLGDTLANPEEEERFDFEPYVAKLSKEYQDFYYACHHEETKYIGIYEYCEKMGYVYGGRYNERFKIALVKAMGYSPDETLLKHKQKRGAAKLKNN